MAVKIKANDRVKALFGDWQETIIWSCLQGVMGELYADCAQTPSCAAAVLGDFCCFAGEPQEEFVADLARQSAPGRIFMLQNESWADAVRAGCQGRVKPAKRYALKKEPGIFDLQKLENIVAALPKQYELVMIDEPLYHKCRTLAWCRDWVANFEDYELFCRYALGAVILKDGEPVAGASSYSAYRGGIEVEIVTKEAFRRQGLAIICGAKLILECEKRGLYPSWDAQNPVSAHLAQQLGYHDAGAYEVYILQ
mgnify:CR=1 FL=1